MCLIKTQKITKNYLNNNLPTKIVLRLIHNYFNKIANNCLQKFKIVFELVIEEIRKINHVGLLIFNLF